MTRIFILVIACVVTIFTCSVRCCADQSQARLVQTIVLEGVHGRLDHLALSGDGRLLALAAFGNNTVEIIDTKNGARIRSLPGFHQPQGVLFVPEFGKLYVTNAEGGDLSILDAATFEKLKTIHLGNDADNLRYDESAKIVYVGYDQSIGAIDPKNDEFLGSVSLSGHPESFQIERKDSLIYANVPGVNEVATINKKTRAKISFFSYSLDLRDNFAMALDESGGRIFVGFRNPSVIVVFDRKGSVLSEIAAPSDIDDIFFDEQRQVLVAAGGEGIVRIFRKTGPNSYPFAEDIHTSVGARTFYLSPTFGVFFVAIPERSGRPARVQTYELLDSPKAAAVT